MIFNRVDAKKNCNLVITENQNITETRDFEGLSATWSHFNELPDDVLVAQLVCMKKTIDEACPESLQGSWDLVNKKMNYVKKSLLTAKVDCNINCVYDIVPEHILLDYYNVKNQITKHIIDNTQRPKIYDHLHATSTILSEIKSRKVNIDMTKLKRALGPSKINRFFKKLKNMALHVNYDIFGTKTGRLTCKRGTFPILNLDKELRKFIVPNNDLFLEIDVNGAELRALLFLLNKKQPSVDIHDWNCKNIFKDSTTRDEAKKRVFAWLYNQESKDDLLNAEYDRDSIKNKFFDGQKILTPYNRNIECDEFHAVNYILQSFSNDMILEQAQKINLTLKDRNSNIAFLMHDSLILDYSSEDSAHVIELVNMFENTRFGKTRANVKIGKNLLDLREVSWNK
tara:strand:+ start:3056 stop:4249 length:1194 start_codon:yes stop_codon:yes gene_type:complete